MRRFPAWTLAFSGREGFTRTVSLRPKPKPLMTTRPWGRTNSKLGSSLTGVCSKTIVSPSWWARWGPSATAVATVGSPMISVLPKRDMTLTCVTASDRDRAAAAGASAAGARADRGGKANRGRARPQIALAGGAEHPAVDLEPGILPSPPGPSPPPAAQISGRGRDRLRAHAQRAHAQP